jgi:cell fate regulator YaaT (PSP1 superfamily)
MQHYYVRVGALGEIHLAEGDSSLTPGQRVILRTARGVELGWIASPLRRFAADPAGNPPNKTAQVVRPTTPQDELLLKRLERHKRRAVEACRIALAESGSKATLLDVDQIFDGGTLVMHFLGDADEQAEAITAEIAAQYEAVVRSRHFAKLLHDGCGPGCGTAEAGGCGEGGGCSQCGLAVSCASRSE